MEESGSGSGSEESSSSSDGPQIMDAEDMAMLTNKLQGVTFKQKQSLFEYIKNGVAILDAYQ